MWPPEFIVRPTGLGEPPGVLVYYVLQDHRLHSSTVNQRKPLNRVAVVAVAAAVVEGGMSVAIGAV